MHSLNVKVGVFAIISIELEALIISVVFTLENFSAVKTAIVKQILIQIVPCCCIIKWGLKTILKMSAEKCPNLYLLFK